MCIVVIEHLIEQIKISFVQINLKKTTDICPGVVTILVASSSRDYNTKKNTVISYIYIHKDDFR